MEWIINIIIGRTYVGRYVLLRLLSAGGKYKRFVFFYISCLSARAHTERLASHNDGPDTAASQPASSIKLNAIRKRIKGISFELSYLFKSNEQIGPKKQIANEMEDNGMEKKKKKKETKIKWSNAQTSAIPQ